LQTCRGKPGGQYKSDIITGFIWLLYLISDDYTRKNRAFLFSKAAKTHISVLDKLHKLKAIGMQKQQSKPFHKLCFLSGITFIVFLFYVTDEVNSVFFVYAGY
jgi:hypothetical protein